jgi:hypothetical protein
MKKRQARQQAKQEKHREREQTIRALITDAPIDVPEVPRSPRSPCEENVGKKNQWLDPEERVIKVSKKKYHLVAQSQSHKGNT